MNISILASIGAQNLGDELILKNEIQLLKNEFGNKSPLMREISEGQRDLFFRIFTYDTSEIFFQDIGVGYQEYFPIGIKNPRNILRNIRNFISFLITLIWSDIVIIGGGGIIYDSEIQSVRNPLDQWVFRTNIARLFGKKLYFYAVGIDIKQEENFQKLEQIFKKAYRITVRDQKSKEQLQKIKIQSEIVEDPVMNDNFLNPLQKGNILGIHNSRAFRLTDFDAYNVDGIKIGLAFRSGYFGTSGDARVEILIIEELCAYLEKRGAKIIFLPHSFHKTDASANDYEFLKQFLTKDREICSSMEETYSFYTSSDFHSTSPDSSSGFQVYESGIKKMIISMRLHSIILSSVYNIDQIVLSYSQKTEEVIKKLIN